MNESMQMLIAGGFGVQVLGILGTILISLINGKKADVIRDLCNSRLDVVRHELEAANKVSAKLQGELVEIRQHLISANHQLGVANRRLVVANKLILAAAGPDPEDPADVAAAEKNA